MEFILGYLNNCYPTLLLLAAMLVVSVVNRSAKILRVWMLHILVLIIFALSLAEYSERWIDLKLLDYHLLYFKSMTIYILYPMVALILLFIIGNIKYKMLVSVPVIINSMIAVYDLSGACLMYGHTSDHGFLGGPFHKFPFLVEDIYIIFIVYYSVKRIKEKNISKGIILAFIVLGLFTAEALSGNGMPNLYMPTVIAAIMFTYYFYLAAIQHLETVEELNESRLALESNRSNLLLAQIRPHFINNNLAVIRSLCYEDPEKAVEMIDHFSGYLQENIKQIDDMHLVPFNKEMESVDNYLYLEEQRFPGRIEVLQDIEITDFEVPPLSVQTIVENAIRHGISMKGGKGTVRISTKEKDDEIILKVEDDGKGFDITTTNFDGINHVGIKNVQDRFRRILGGSVDVESEVGRGTVVTFHIPKL